MSTPSQKTVAAEILVRPMRETDLVSVRRIFRVAFGTFIGVPNPEEFWADREYVFTRWRRDPGSALVAELNGAVVGSNFLTRWGSFGLFGPLTVRPDLWDQRVAQKLLDRTMEIFAEWGVRETGLFTFAHSAKHLGLYYKFGYWPWFLTAIMSKPASAQATSVQKFSSMKNQDEALSACRRLTDSIYKGLDVTLEIRAVADQNLGETLLLWDGDVIDALAVCHCGEGSEAGRDTCYVKFAAVRPAPNAGHAFERLLDGCEALANERGLARVEVGTNLSRREAYRRMLERGFRTAIQGHRPDSPGYNRPDVFAIDDWR